VPSEDRAHLVHNARVSHDLKGTDAASSSRRLAGLTGTVEVDLESAPLWSTEEIETRRDDAIHAAELSQEWFSLRT
jgi:hypothetical protein